MATLKTIQADDVRAWCLASRDLRAVTGSIGARVPDGEFLDSLGVPFHLRFAAEKLAEELGTPVDAAAFDSIPFYSLCRGLFLPLSQMEPERAAQLFGVRIEPPPDSAGREALIGTFLGKDLGLTVREKLGCILGDPFLGRKSTLRRDSLLRLLASTQMRSRREMLDRLAHVGDVAVLFAESRPQLRSDPPLTAAEVLRTLRYLPGERLLRKFDLLRGLLARCGRLEAFFLAKLVLRKAGFGFDYQGPLLARALASQFGASAEEVTHAMALTDAFHVSATLEREGPAGLKAIRLQPLVPVRPALAGGTTDDLERFPVWIERKYDGIRFMLHKSTDRTGATLCGAYTRAQNDWLEQVPGLDSTIRLLPCRSAIVDGELFGSRFDLDGVRPATVYEVYAFLQSAGSPVTLKFAAFDLLLLNGQDLTSLPLSQRRQMLAQLLTPLAGAPLPIPLSLAEGQLANDKHDVNRLYEHFRAQGYEGLIAKELASPYLLATRDPTWMKRKPVITLDLALVGATYAVTTKENAGLFGSYVIAARTDTGFDIVGDVAGVDRVRDQEIQNEILRDGLLTGRRIERPSSSGVRAGVELRPSLVATIKFEGIVRDQVTGALSLRDPKVAMLRSDKSAGEADTMKLLEEMYLRQRVG